MFFSPLVLKNLCLCTNCSTADAAVRSVIYRVAHVHCSNGNASEVSRTLHAQVILFIS